MRYSDEELKNSLRDAAEGVSDLLDKSRVSKALSSERLQENAEKNLAILQKYQDLIVEQGANATTLSTELTGMSEINKQLKDSFDLFNKTLIDKNNDPNRRDITKSQKTEFEKFKDLIEKATTPAQLKKAANKISSTSSDDNKLIESKKKLASTDLNILKSSINYREKSIELGNKSNVIVTKFNSKIALTTDSMDRILSASESGYNRENAYGRLKDGKGLTGVAKGYFSDTLKNAKTAQLLGPEFVQKLTGKGGITGLLSKQMTGSMGKMLGGKMFGLAGMAAQYIFDQAKVVDASAGGMAKMYGSSYGRGAGYVNQGIIANPMDGLKFGFADAKDALENAKTLFTASEHLNFNNFDSGKNMMQDTAMMRGRLGFQGAEASKYQVMKFLFGDSSTDKHMKELGEAVQGATHGMVSYKTIVEDVGKLSKDQISYFGDYNKAMLQSTKALGMGLNAAVVQKTGMGYYDDIPGLIKKSMTSQLLTGQSSGNINKAISYSMNDQFVEAVGEMMGDTTLSDFNSLKSWQKKSKAESVGLSVGQLSQSLKIKDLLGDVSTEELERIALTDDSKLTDKQKEAKTIFGQMNDTRSVAERSEDVLKGISTNVQGILSYMIGDTQAEQDADLMKKKYQREGMAGDTAESLRDLRAQSKDRVFNNGADGAEMRALFSSSGYKNASKEEKINLLNEANKALTNNDVNDMKESSAFLALEKEANAQGVQIVVNVDQHAQSSKTVNARAKQVRDTNRIMGGMGV